MTRAYHLCDPTPDECWIAWPSQITNHNFPRRSTRCQTHSSPPIAECYSTSTSTSCSTLSAFLSSPTVIHRLELVIYTDPLISWRGRGSCERRGDGGYGLSSAIYLLGLWTRARATRYMHRHPRSWGCSTGDVISQHSSKMLQIQYVRYDMHVCMHAYPQVLWRFCGWLAVLT